MSTQPGDQPATSGRFRIPSRYWVACLLFVSLATVYIGLIVYLDNTNLATANGLWKSPWVHAWELGTDRPVDTGDLFYLPAYGLLCRLIPDQAVSYGIPGKVVTYRKMAVLNALFSALSSCAVFLLALRFTSSVTAALLVAFAHASTGFVLLHSVNSEDVTPAYAFFVLAVLHFFAYVQTRKFRRLVLCAGSVVLTTVFHWTLMIPVVVALGAAQLVLVVKRKRPVWLLAACPLLLLGMAAVAALIVHLLYPGLSSPLREILYPTKAGPDGWSGFTANKFLYALIGIGNYFSGARSLGDYRVLAYPDLLRPMIVSWLYWALCMGVSVWALLDRRTSGHLRLLAGIGVVLFGVGELESLYVFPHDPQWQMQPMFISITALIVVLNYLHLNLSTRTFRLVVASLTLLFLMNGMWTARIMSASRGADSRAVAEVRELERLFPPDRVTTVSHGFETWDTWWYVEVLNGDWNRYTTEGIQLFTPFTDRRGTSAAAAAEIVKRRIGQAFAAGRRVVACSLWVQKREDFVGWMTTLVENERAEAYYDALRGAFRLGKTWYTPVGRFVELLPAAPAPSPTRTPAALDR